MEEHEYHKTLTTTTPLQRLRSNFESPSPGIASQTPWTAARCQRLLRPLSSKILHLKRLNSERLHRLDAAGKTKSGAGGSGPANKPVNETIATAKLCKQSSKEADPDWDCDAPTRKKIKRTYSGKTPSLKVGSESQSKCFNNRPLKTEPMNILPQMLSQEPSSSSNLETSYLQVRASRKDIEASRKREYLPASSFSDVNGLSELREEFAAPGGGRDRWKLFKGISDSLIAILHATQTRNNTKSGRTGSRSLFATCLKQVPEVISLEERWALTDDPDHDRNIPSEIYCELESSAVCDGWQPLRVIVRAHSIFLIQAAFEDGTLGVKSMIAIANLCCRNDAYDEAQTLLHALIVSVTCRKFRGSGPNLQHHDMLILSALCDFAESTGRYGFFYQQLSRFIVSGVGSKSCCDAIVSVYLNVAIQHAAAAAGDHAVDAARFLQTIVRKGMSGSVECSKAEYIRQAGLDRPSHRFKKLSKGQRTQIEGKKTGTGPAIGMQQGLVENLSVDFDGLVAVIHTICNVRLTASVVEGRGQLPDTLEQLTVEAHRCSEVSKVAKQDSHPTEVETQNLATILLADLISSSNIKALEFDNGLTTFEASEPFGGLVISDNMVDQLSNFICKVARCHGQVAEGMALDSMKKMVALLARLAQSAASESLTRSIMGRIAVGAAFTFVEDSNLPANLDWALEVEQAMKPQVEATLGRAFIRTPAKPLAQARSRFRWEDGICEWIEKTPAMQKERSRSSSAAPMKIDDSGDDLSPDTHLSRLEVAASPVPTLPPKQARPDVAYATSFERSSLAFATCVKITTSNPKPVTISVGQRTALPDTILAKNTSDAVAFQNGAGSPTHDYIDELSAVQHASWGICNRSRSDLRERSLLSSSPSRLNGHTKGVRRKGVGTYLPMGRAAIQSSMMALVDRENIHSDTEDELSFS